ncbi:uncharacterized protein PHACADRAFT_119928 [Phanerochaete carnosa HHB-10118-sp]|uniref:Uncharacterized protein n=1 Tax=Phanerochaete carnosa (strain HHB-10118-sp) TaxID=650164 RepID=K5W778_PHACS|nr:uncharacterized protein PHACADRAFT_119928 [Phanerochaete carnosa HHB-10118-sp]EKM55025.1 hypothetical protein PHACADRAFT_119928 [Phanerochaete carnosa HHB-10118-sp]
MFGQVSPRRSNFSEAANEQAEAEHEIISLNPLAEDKHMTSSSSDEFASHNRNSQPLSGESVRESERTDIMSPVELMTGPPFWHPIGNLPQTFQREDSVDSGYADNWTGPQQFVLSPPHRDTPGRYSTLSLLSSPFGSPARAISPKFAPTALSGWPPGSPRSGTSNSESVFEHPHISNHGGDHQYAQSFDELDSPRKYEAERKRRSDASRISDADPDKTIKQSRPSSLHVAATKAHGVDVASSSSASSVIHQPPTKPSVHNVSASPEPPQTIYPLEPSPFLLGYEDEGSSFAAPEPGTQDEPPSIESPPSPAPRSTVMGPASTSFDHGRSPIAALPIRSPHTSPQRSPSRRYSGSPCLVQLSTTKSPAHTSQSAISQRSPASLHLTSPSPAAPVFPATSIPEPLSNPFSPSSSHSPLQSVGSGAPVQHEAEEHTILSADLYAAHVNSPVFHENEVDQEAPEDAGGQTVSYASHYRAVIDPNIPPAATESEDAAEERSVSFASLYAAQLSPVRRVPVGNVDKTSSDEQPKSYTSNSQARTSSPAQSAHDKNATSITAEDRAVPYSSIHESPVAGPSRLANPPVQMVSTESTNSPEQTFSYASFYDEAPLADPTRHSTPRSTLSRSVSLRSMSTPLSERTVLSRSASMRATSTPRSDRSLSRSSIRSSARRTPSALPARLSSPTPSISNTTDSPLLHPLERDSTLLSPCDSPYASPRAILVHDAQDNSVQDVPTNRRLSRDAPRSPDHSRAAQAASPYSLDSPPATAASEPLGSPAASRRSSISDFQPNSEGQTSRKSSKVAFGFRNSTTVGPL